MIENIRKYSGLMIVVFVILFVSFFFLDSSALQSVGGRGAVLKIDGKGYMEKDYRRLGASSFDLVSGFISSGDFSLYPFMMGLTGNATSKEDATERFFINRMILRSAQEDYGIFPSEEEISNHLRSMRPFAGQDGKFSQDIYRNFIEKGIGRLGMTEHDLRELASDILVSKKLNTLLGSGLVVSREEIAKTLAMDNQQIDVGIARLDIALYAEKIQPTDEEVKAYWENIQDAFVTEPRRSFTYIVATPKLPADAKETPPAATENATGEEKTADEASAKIAEERRKSQLELDSQVDDFLYSLEQHKGTGFEDLAKENGWEVKKTDLFSLSNAPPDLNLALRSSSTGSKAAEELFNIQETSDPFSKISEAIAVGENQWIIARLDGEEKSRAKSFEEAKDAARVQYIAEKAAEEMKKAAETAREAIKASLTTGKSFEEAAKEAGLSHVSSAPKITRFSTPDGSTQPRNLFEAARAVDPGSLADVVVESDRAFILHVTKREVVKAADAAARLDSEVASRSTENEIIAFTSWLNARHDAANIERLYQR